MMKVTLNGKEFEVAPELYEALMAEMSKAKEGGMVDGKAEMMPEMEKKDGEISKLQAKVDGLTADLATRKDAAPATIDPKVLGEAVKARLAVVKVGEKFGVEKLDSLSDSEIKIEVIKKHSASADLTGKSQAYVDARFDHIAETASASDTKAKELGAAATKETKNDNLDAREKMRADSRDAWKKPLSAMKA